MMGKEVLALADFDKLFVDFERVEGEVFEIDATLAPRTSSLSSSLSI